MARFILFVITEILNLLVLAIIINAIISWLVAFDVINLRNRAAYSAVRFLDAVTRPVLLPFQKIIPTLGGVDVSPIVAILVIEGVQTYLLPWAFAPLIALLGG
jgi:YggT family protein